MKVTAINENGGTVESGWFKDAAKGEAYANAMVARGYVVAKQYKKDVRDEL